ncbi:MAG: hypothetical protein GZ087_13905 [Flavobacterium sp.]|nr:hypothetical protein [Flavobacterium sp.]
MENKLIELENRLTQLSDFFNEMNELQNNRNKISTETVVQFQIIFKDMMKNFAIVKESIEEFENRFKDIESKLQKLSEK